MLRICSGIVYRIGLRAPFTSLHNGFRKSLVMDCGLDPNPQSRVRTRILGQPASNPDPTSNPASNTRDPKLRPGYPPLLGLPGFLQVTRNNVPSNVQISFKFT